MALMVVNIDKRTNAGLTSLDILTYAHGLPATPDAVYFRYIATIATATAWFGLNAAVDAANVTVRNMGDATSPDFEVVAVRFHSLIQ